MSRSTAFAEIDVLLRQIQSKIETFNQLVNQKWHNLNQNERELFDLAIEKTATDLRESN